MTKAEVACLVEDSGSAATGASATARRKNEKTGFWTRRQSNPTYEVVGNLERFDMRDTLDNRAILVPGTERYLAYYSLHPEWEEPDKKLRLYGPVSKLLNYVSPTSDTSATPISAEEKERRRSLLFGDEPLAFALSNTKGTYPLLFAAGCGPVAKERVDMEPAVAARNIKGVARYVGAELAGICEINQAWVYTHWGRDESYGGRWGEPIDLTHRYAIALVVAHNFEMLLAGRGLGVCATIETDEIYSRVAAAAVRLASYIRALGYPAEAHIGCGKVNTVPVAVDAGLGEVGRNGLLITKEYGPAVRICVVTTDLPMVVDKPVDLGIQDFCARCFKCADTCSSGSISKREKELLRGVKLWPVDNESCIRMRLSQGGAPTCFNCLSCCPYTKPRNFIHQSAGWLAARSSLARTGLVWLDDFLYGRKPRQHPFPGWLEADAQKLNFRERLSILLHRI